MCDTGPLVAAISRSDRHHELCRDLIEAHASDALIVPITVAVEVDYLVRARIGGDAARAFLADLDEGRYVAEPVDAAALARARDIDTQYADADLGLVDASVIATAEILDADAVMTLDHDHLRLAGNALALLPESVER